MAIAAGTKTTNVTNPGGTTVTFNHSQNTGDDRFLVIAIAHNKSNHISNIKYNNVTLTSRLYHNGSTNKYGFFVYIHHPQSLYQHTFQILSEDYHFVQCITHQVFYHKEHRHQACFLQILHFQAIREPFLQEFPCQVY